MVTRDKPPEVNLGVIEENRRYFGIPYRIP